MQGAALFESHHSRCDHGYRTEDCNKSDEPSFEPYREIVRPVQDPLDAPSEGRGEGDESDTGRHAPDGGLVLPGYGEKRFRVRPSVFRVGGNRRIADIIARLVEAPGVKPENRLDGQTDKKNPGDMVPDKVAIAVMGELMDECLGKKPMIRRQRCGKVNRWLTDTGQKGAHQVPDLEYPRRRDPEVFREAAAFRGDRQGSWHGASSESADGYIVGYAPDKEKDRQSDPDNDETHVQKREESACGPFALGCVDRFILRGCLHPHSIVGVGGCFGRPPPGCEACCWVLILLFRARSGRQNVGRNFGLRVGLPRGRSSIRNYT